MLVESHENRPTKIEGNPDHPASGGRVDAFALASILNLYDPDRSQVVVRHGRISRWTAFAAELKRRLEAQRLKDGAELRILTRTTTSPTEAALLAEILEAFPRAKWTGYDPVSRDAARAGARAAFGEDAEAHCRFDKARVILSLEADFLSDPPSGVRATREFTSGRRLDDGNAEMNRLYAVESSSSPNSCRGPAHTPSRTRSIMLWAQSVRRSS